MCFLWLWIAQFEIKINIINFFPAVSLFPSIQETQYLSKQTYCEQFGALIPLNGLPIANMACCACGGGTYPVQLINATVVRHPTQGRADLFLPRNILNGEILVVKYTKHATNSSRWIGGEDGLFSDSWDRLVVENNVWPTLLNSYVPNENASIITLEFTGRGIVHGQR